MIIPLSVTEKKSGEKIAVLSPKEWYLIRDELNLEYQIRGDFFLYTGMRIAESYHVAEHPEYFRKENAAIFLPHVDGLGKKRCTVKQRVITLNAKGVAAVEEFFSKKVGLAAYQNMGAAFKLAAKKADFDTSLIKTKMFRKTIISWLMTVYPNQQSQISRFAGHDAHTMDNYYLASGWRKEDKQAMAAELAGWGEI
jgi:integrase